MRWGSSLLICVRPFRFTVQSEDRGREQESESRDEQRRQAKGTENKWSGRENKARGEGKEEIRWEEGGRLSEKMG